MAGVLLIVESPSKAKTIGKFLGRNYKVEPSNGHVRDLPKSQMGVDVEADFEPKYITIRGRGDIVDRIRKEAKGAKRILLATDPDREGEAIAWHLANILKMDQNQPCRVEFNEITAPAIKAAVKKPRPINQDLVDAQQARRVLDRLVGYKISPLLWSKVRKGLSAGRVQSVATRMICQREEEIRAFKPQEYWTIAVSLTCGGKKFIAKYYGIGEEKAAIDNQRQAEAIAEQLRQAAYEVLSVKVGEKKRNPPPPFTTSSLQQEAVKKLNFTTKRTQMIAQQLYEGVDIKGEGTVGLISYIRTDSVRVSEEAQQAALKHIAEQYGPEYAPEKANQYKGRKGAQDAHEAIRPTSVERLPSKIKESLSAEQFKLYRLIYERFMASQMTPARFETRQVVIACGEHRLRANGSRMIFAGYTACYQESREDNEEKEVALPAIEMGSKLTFKEVLPEQHFTQPPARYTEATLVRALEENGIGRPSTYAPTISTILDRGYVSRESKALAPTELGEVVTGLMEQYFEPIVDVDFTAQMEANLDNVEEGKEPWKQVIRDFYPGFDKMLQVAEEQISKMPVEDVVSDVPCEKCGAMMVYKMGRFGKFLACPNFPECRNTKPIVQTLDVPCPVCGGDLVVKRSKKARRPFYGCSNYPECQFVSWDMPVAEKCPVCGGYMVQKRDRKGNTLHVCANEQCKHTIVLENTDDEEN
ncbi:MAG: type I DNA topoisomerase [Christensenellales bacterium]|jgi:DNA topoisomerase-1